MVRAAFTTLGCKVNQYETQRILESFEERGFTVVPFNEPADVYVVNTCSVTQAGESKSRQTLRRAARQNRDAKIVATGCAGEMARRRGETLPDAHLIVPNPDKLRTADRFLAAFPEFAVRLAQGRPSANNARPPGRTRATVKLQDGCDVLCSYCSIPFTRPMKFSRPADEVLEEVRKLSLRGYKEVVLTGVLVGDYGPADGSGGPDLVELVERMTRIEGIERIRISSIETTTVSKGLLELIRDEPKLCPHLHIPLQSGDNRVLRDMNRPYTREDYLDLCRRAKEVVPGLALTTDILVGFPTEDEEAVGSTLDMVERVGYLAAHVFRYSPRPGTPAGDIGDPVHGDVKAERSRRVSEAASRTGAAYRRSFLGREMRVLVEGRAPGTGLLRGHTDNYIETHFPGPTSAAGEMVTARLDELGDGVVFGELAADPVRGEGRLPALSGLHARRVERA